MPGARLRGLTKRHGPTVALDDLSLELADGELVVVVGPSGCGKSTLLRLVAGLEEPTAGEIHIGDRRVDGLPPQQRDVAMVFQSYALYPHMTVRGNVEFPLQMTGMPRRERAARVAEIAELLDIGDLLGRRPAALSGGQRQRVALARALVRRPSLFLLDEPLSNLDARLRTSVRQYIRDLQRRVGVTTLYVTHDQTEAMTLGHRLVVLDRGRTQMVAAPLEAYARPANVFVAGFLGSPGMSLVSASVAAGRLSVGGQTIALPSPLARLDGPVVVGIRPEAFVAAGETSTGADAGLVARPLPETIEALGSETVLRADVGGQEVTARLSGTAETPSRLLARVPDLHFFSSGDGRRLAP